MSTKNVLPQSADWKLPRGWRFARLGDICLVNPRRSEITRTDSESTTFVPMPAVDEDGKGISRPEVKPYGQIKKGYTFFAEGDVLFAKITPCMQNGKHAVARDLLGGIGFGSTEFHVLRATETVLAEWIHAFLIQPDVMRAASAHFTGTVGQQRVPDSFLSDLIIPVPPLSEQKRLAVVLVDQMNMVEQARLAGEAQLQASKKLLSAVLAEAFHITKTDTWRKVPLGEVGQIGAGVTLGRDVRGASTRAVPYLRVANVKDGHLDISSLYTVEATQTEISKCRLQYGDLLLTEGGDPDKLGRGTFWEDQVSECIHQNHIFRVRFDLTRFSPAFLSALIGSPYGKAYFLAHAKQTTGIATINQKVLANFPLLLPPFEEQKRIAAHLQCQMATAQEIQAAVQAQLDGIKSMPPALLAQAFSGQLSHSPSFRTRRVSVPAATFDLRGAVSSYIVNRLHDQPSFGNIQHQKLLFLAETHVGLELGGVYYRDKWGPHEGLDFYRLNGRRKWAEQRGAFHLRKRQGLRGYSYTLGPNMNEQVAVAEAAMGDRKPALDALLDLFAPMTTDQAEMFATLFAAWNDFLIAGHTPMDAEIIQEFRENWHERKKKFTPDQLRDGLAFMRAHQLVPRGIGPATKTKN